MPEHCPRSHSLACANPAACSDIQKDPSSARDSNSIVDLETGSEAGPISLADIGAVRSGSAE